MAIILQNMAKEEKLKLMEALWEDLTKENDLLIESPQWHADVLKQRNEDFKAGKENAEDWTLAKEKIRKQIS